MTFAQVIDFKTGRYSDLDQLMDRWVEQTKGKRTASHSLIGKDRADGSHFVEIIEFPSYEEAMANSNLPETNRIFEEMVALCDGMPTFTDLDVVRNDQLNASTARRFFHEIATGGNLDAIDEVFAADYADHDIMKEQDTVVGSDGIRSDVTRWRSAFDFAFELDRQICEGDDVVTLWTLNGTHTGDFMGIPATGKQVGMTGTTIFRFKNDKIQEGWWHYDAMKLMKQLGAAG
ncbi:MULTISPECIES: ester cyclase [unclassified Streptomyces]|uniref:ester cyclase n=1 Tax=unclassified Streptomyces TaxID=2593676 RepID=UPI0006ADA4CF|nr:ester cyclase [Streptomyces sp. WM6378]KOU40161.1 SnoaL-like polyketide cyclase [Streptomyces sp. WM6378]